MMNKVIKISFFLTTIGILQSANIPYFHCSLILTAKKVNWIEIQMKLLRSSTCCTGTGTGSEIFLIPVPESRTLMNTVSSYRYRYQVPVPYVIMELEKYDTRTGTPDTH
jgi:hypothetical protein